MTPLPDSEYAKLERLAEKATPGPYHVDKQGSPDSGIVRSIDDARGHEVALATTGDMTDAQEARNADYFAALSPQTVLAMVAERRALRAEVERLTGLLNSPELIAFSEAVTLEAAHQRERWGTEHDTGKKPEDWFWLVGYLAGKCLASQKAGNAEKALHHTISTAAALANWHAAILGASNAMQPGHAPSAEIADRAALNGAVHD